jgi:curved DNA-binding protein CbpA
LTGWAGTALYRLLAKEMHPDKRGGDRDLRERLDAAATLLGVRRGNDA